MSTILTVKQIQGLAYEPQALALLPKTEAARTECLFFNQTNHELSLLTTNNHPDAYHEILDKHTESGYKINSFFTDQKGFAQAMKRYDTREKEQQEAITTEQYKLHVAGQEAVKLLQDTFAKRHELSEGDFLEEMLRLSYQAGASDVHFQTEEQGVYMRLRKDGILQPLVIFPIAEFAKYLMKFKFMAGVKMNIVGHSQDGRMTLPIHTEQGLKHIDVRLSFLPTLRGESIVLRLLDATKGIKTVTQLGMRPWHATVINKQLQAHHGLILVTGPTGSGKTTTVYSLLHSLNTADKKIITLEDPIEYEIAGISQSQINESIGYTFEEGLKGVLRHDPDIIMVGEIRSLDSAELAINAAITGHLVISTVHTNSAVEAISRLLNMGIKPYMLASAINCIIGQRLVRKAIDPVPIPATDELDKDIMSLETRLKKLLPMYDMPYNKEVYSQNMTLGSTEPYEGRVGIFECLVMDAELKQAILDQKTTIDLQKIMDKNGFLNMYDDALLKMLEKITTIEEIERVV